jgi:replicative DNA helicase
MAAARTGNPRKGPRTDIGDVQAEEAIVAALLATPAAYDDVVEIVAADDFLDPRCAAVFRAITAVEAAGKPIDRITVADELKRQRQLTKVGGVEGLESFAAAGGDVAHVAAHVAIVADKAKLRRTIEAGQQMCAAALHPAADAGAVVDEAEALVFNLSRDRSRSSLTPMAKAVPELLAELARGHNGELLGCSTGFPELDRLTGGFQPGQLILVAARPGVGKSALALQMARHISETTGMAVPFLSYEMSVSELTVRLLGGALRCDITELRNGNIPGDMERDLAVAAERLASVPLLIDDNPPTTISGVRSSMRRLARRTQIAAVFIDYLQLIDSGGGARDATRNDVVSEITRGAKRLAVELGVPVIGLSQLSRAVTQRGGKPRLSDLRDSGSLEQDANVVMFVVRDIESPHADPTRASLLLAKQRSGVAGVEIPLSYLPASTVFSPAPTSGYGAGTYAPPPPPADERPF